MKRRLLASKRDVTGLACIVGMGLLVLLAWATLPHSPDPSPGEEDQADQGDTIHLHAPPIVSDAIDPPVNGPDPEPRENDAAVPRANIGGAS